MRKREKRRTRDEPKHALFILTAPPGPTPASPAHRRRPGLTWQLFFSRFDDTHGYTDPDGAGHLDVLHALFDRGGRAGEIRVARRGANRGGEWLAQRRRGEYAGGYGGGRQDGRQLGGG